MIRSKNKHKAELQQVRNEIMQICQRVDDLFTLGRMWGRIEYLEHEYAAKHRDMGKIIPFPGGLSKKP